MHRPYMRLLEKSFALCAAAAGILIVAFKMDGVV